MKLLLVNTYPRGGAANACLRLHEGLLKIGVDSQLLLRESYSGQLPNISTYRTPEVAMPTHPPLSLRSWWYEKRTKSYQKQVEKYQIYLKELEEQQQFIRSRPKGLEMFSFPTSNYDFTKSEAYQNVDLINLHWVADFLDYKSFFQKNKKPVVWTLHDMSAFTGGDHCEESYWGINENTGKPKKRRYTDAEKILHKKVLEQKKTIFSQVDGLHVVTPSVWLSKELNKSNIIKPKSYHIIPNSVDTDIFCYKDRGSAREVLGISQKKSIMLFVSTSLERTLKGFAFLLKSIESLQERRDDFLLLTIGQKNNTFKLKNTFDLGYIQDERLLSIAYAAADVFVIPSLMDNLPNTVLESLCCGTPVVGFPVGGIPDMVQDGKNGYLCPEISVDALTATLEKFLANPDVFDREEIAKTAAKKYALEVQAEAYKKLYEEILSES